MHATERERERETLKNFHIVLCFARQVSSRKFSKRTAPFNAFVIVSTCRHVNFLLIDCIGTQSEPQFTKSEAWCIVSMTHHHARHRDSKVTSFQILIRIWNSAEMPMLSPSLSLSYLRCKLPGMSGNDFWLSQETQSLEETKIEDIDSKRIDRSRFFSRTISSRDFSILIRAASAAADLHEKIEIARNVIDAGDVTCRSTTARFIDRSWFELIACEM